MPADKLDLYKAHKDQYKATAKPRIVELPPIHYLVVEAEGSPTDDRFMEVMGALYGIAYTLKFMYKNKGQDFVVSKLEGMWFPEGGFDQKIENPSEMNWKYKLMIRMPEFVRQDDLPTAREQLEKKKKEGPFDLVNLSIIEEGTVVQALHIGPYAEETPTLEAMHTWAGEQGYKHLPNHHEIYLSDPRRGDPQNSAPFFARRLKRCRDFSSRYP